MKEKNVKILLSLVKKNYAEIAAEFDVSRKKNLWPMMTKLAAEIGNGVKILDAGCGNGRLLEAFKNKSIEYFGFDNSAELIELAKKNYPNDKFVVLDILNLDSLPDSYYDFIFCVAVILHLPGEETRIKALQEMAKKLKRSGKIFVSVWDLYGQKKYRNQLFWSNILSCFTWRGLESGDLFFFWKNNKGVKLSRRYYHAFKERELLVLIKKAGLISTQVLKMDSNIWLVLEKRRED